MMLGAADLRLTGLLGRLRDLLFPLRCPGCGLRGSQLCDACQEHVPWLGPEVCPLCAVPRRSGWPCGRCRDDPGRLDGVRAACRFDGLARQAIHELKYRGVRSRADLLADFVVQPIEARPLSMELLIPVPLSDRRRRERGFNQAELIAQALAGRIGVPIAADCLRRGRHTAPQVGQNAADRSTNVAGAFICSAPGAVCGRRVGIVDDVMTTGSTLRACADALRAAGAARVFGVVVAREV